MITKSSILEKIQNPTSIVLFGSFAKGTNNEDSDIDILIITNNKKPIDLLDIKGHELQIIQLTPLEWKEKVKKDKPFYHEVITTGIPLIGELPL
jgi:predicted nucleotidyltransferase